MSIERAQQIAARASAIFDSKQKEVLKELVNEIYSDMVSGSYVMNIIAGTSATIGGVGTVSIAVDKADPSAPVLNLSFEPADE
jgi:5'-3' exonuclease